MKKKKKEAKKYIKEFMKYKTQPEKRELLDLEAVAYKALMSEDFETAALNYEKGAKLGDPHAKRSISIMYYHGQYYKKDAEMSFHWAKKAANKGFIKAINQVAYSYLYGDGAKLDIKEAISWASKAILTKKVPSEDLNNSVDLMTKAINYKNMDYERRLEEMGRELINMEEYSLATKFFV